MEEQSIEDLLNSGSGETIYELSRETIFHDVSGGSIHGLSPTELTETLHVLDELATRMRFQVTILRQKNDTPTTLITEVLLRRIECDLEIRVVVVGNVDAGKSTLIGVLTHELLDDGRGLARSKIFRHKHELETGRTSSVTHESMGFDTKGRQVSLDTSHIPKTISFLDLAGHQKYFGTTLFGMMGHQPDYAMLLVGSNMGVVGTTKEHLGVTMALRIPVMVVITKVDLCPPEILKQTLDQLRQILKSQSCQKIPILVRNLDDLMVCVQNFHSGRVTPIFCVSSVIGTHLNHLKQFLNLLPSTHNWIKESTHPVEMPIDSVWNVTGFGTVVCGTVSKGRLNTTDPVMLGPMRDGSFRPVTFKSLYCKDRPASEAKAGQSASVSLRKVDRSDVRKGMVLISPQIHPVASMEFEAEVVVLYHSTTITLGYESVVHCGALQQTARMIKMDREVIRAGDKAQVTFRFIFYPVYMAVGSRLIFRDGSAKGIGKVIKT